MALGRELPQLLKQRLLYKGRKFDFEVNHLRLPNKSEGDWECIRHPGGALAIPVTEDGKLILLRQYRFAVGEIRDEKLGKIGMPLRAALTGSDKSPAIFEAAAILGKDETLSRIRAALN